MEKKSHRHTVFFCLVFAIKWICRSLVLFPPGSPVELDICKLALPTAAFKRYQLVGKQGQAACRPNWASSGWGPWEECTEVWSPPGLSTLPQVQIPLLCAPADSCGPFPVVFLQQMRTCDMCLHLWMCVWLMTRRDPVETLCYSINLYEQGCQIVTVFQPKSHRKTN